MSINVLVFFIAWVISAVLAGFIPHGNLIQFIMLGVFTVSLFFSWLESVIHNKKSE